MSDTVGPGPDGLLGCAILSFIYYDNVSYIRNNDRIKAGLTWDGLVWALTDVHTGYWHPLTWLSHMLDWQLFRGNAGGHHWSSVILHLCNALLLFTVLQAMTKETGKSAFVAVLFALHPLNVESVAWVAERKNVLSTFWGLLALYLYVIYTQRPRWDRYLLVFFSCALGLMAKPMLVTLPFVLLLVDYWPLRRFPRRGAETGWQSPSGAGPSPVARLILEKIPLLVLSLIVSAGTFLSAHYGGAVRSLNALPLGLRMENAIVSYIAYMGKMIWPAKLAVFYPYAATVSLWQVGVSGLALIVISFSVMRMARKYPYLATGWLWYLGTLVPVIGIVQAGAQAMADRYAYIPIIGLFIIIAWGIPDFTARWHGRKSTLTLVVAASLAGLIACTWRQVHYWRNSVSLFQHAIDVTEANYLAHNNLGVALMEEGRLNEAMDQYREVLKVDPRYVKAHNNMGIALLHQGKADAAAFYFRQALAIDPRYADAHSNLGIALALQRKPAEAAMHFREALRLNPSFGNARDNLKNLKRQFGDAL